MKFLTFTLILVFSSLSSANEFCDLLEVEGRKFVNSDHALSCDKDDDCKYVSSDLLNCGCGGLMVGKGLKTYEAFEKIHEDVCGISCIPECIITGHKKGGKAMINKPFCVEKRCVEKLVELK